jgi:hypothetical protein
MLLKIGGELKSFCSADVKIARRAMYEWGRRGSKIKLLEYYQRVR